MPIQWIITVFAFFAVWRAYAALKGANMDRRKFMYWTMFWIASLVIIWLPQSASILAAYLGVGRGVDLVLYLSVMILFYGLFQASRKVDRLERSLTELIRRLALKDSAKNESDQ